jgi:predicted nucleic acid-binding protein
MKIVVDTNVLISGVFFGGSPRKVLSAVVGERLTAVATKEIVDKFLGCAKDARALYIVSGDKDLLVLKQFENIQIVTAKEFCVQYLTES